MKKIESVLVAGAGAIGLMLAGKLYGAIPEKLLVLAEGERLERYRRDGFFINDKKFDFSLSGDASPSAVDLVIIASKYYSLNEVIGDIRPFIGPDTVIISLLNGISSEDVIGAKYGRERLPLSMVMGTDAQHNGNRVNYSRIGVINFGDADGIVCERDERIAEFFTRTAYPAEYHKTDMKRALWYKFMINTGANQTSALLRLPYAAFKRKSPRRIPEAQILLEKAMREVIDVSNACGIGLDDNDIESFFVMLEDLNDDGFTSMCQDILAGRKTEIELFGPEICRLGREHGIRTPVNEMLALAVGALEKRAFMKYRE
ncbi:MAG: ketopantoate reductase family protein [Spirochaetaceae bacterium]|jgi:2-dehydropantoate 2-reductase|nr:ketopantoate reductase family protein [Spirochaetaceae bacterium]